MACMPKPNVPPSPLRLYVRRVDVDAGAGGDEVQRAAAVLEREQRLSASGIDADLVRLRA